MLDAFDFCVTARCHRGDIQTGRQPVVVLIEAGEGFALNAQGGSSGNVALVNQLIHNILDGGAGNGKTNAFHTGRVGKGADFHGVDADDLAVAVDEGAAGIAGVQSGVGLNQSHGPSVHIHVPVDGGDNAVGIGAPVFDTQRIPDGSHRISDPQLGGISELGGNQIRGLHLQHSQIGNFVSADEFRGEHPVVCQQHVNGTGTVHHVGVGDDVAVCCENHTGAGGGTAIAFTADGNHGTDVLQIDFLEGQAPFHGNILPALGRLLQLHGTEVGCFFRNHRRLF